MSSKLRVSACMDEDERDSLSNDKTERETLLDASISKEFSNFSEPTSQRLPWLLAALTSTLLALSLLANALQWHASSHTRCIFPTDMHDSRRVIEYERRMYTGALVYDKAENQMIRVKDAEREFFGEPSKEIDDAWKDLLQGEFPPLTDEEAAPYLPELRRMPNTGFYHFEPDMFHNLHCLNALRMEVGKSLYPNSTYEGDGHHHHKGILPPGWEAMHMEHCMDLLRQSIICHGDMTPSPMYYWTGFNVVLGRSGEHTCRRWQPIRDWMDERGSGGTLG